MENYKIAGIFRARCQFMLRRLDAAQNKQFPYSSYIDVSSMYRQISKVFENKFTTEPNCRNTKKERIKQMYCPPPFFLIGPFKMDGGTFRTCNFFARVRYIIYLSTIIS